MANNGRLTSFIKLPDLARPTSQVVAYSLAKKYREAEQVFDKLDGALRSQAYKGYQFTSFQPGHYPDNAWKPILVVLLWQPHESVLDLLDKVAAGDYSDFTTQGHAFQIAQILSAWPLSAFYDRLRDIDPASEEARVNGFGGIDLMQWLEPATQQQFEQQITLLSPVQTNWGQQHYVSVLYSLGVLYGILKYLKEKLTWPARTKRKKVPFAQSAYDRIFDVQQLLRDRAESIVEVPDDDDIGQLPEMPIAILFLLVAFFVFALTQ